jgi:hypothetical protein
MVGTNHSSPGVPGEVALLKAMTERLEVSRRNLTAVSGRSDLSVTASQCHLPCQAGEELGDHP